MLFDARARRQRREHAGATGRSLENLEIDDRVVDGERNQALELERHGLLQLAPVPKRQIENAIGGPVARKSGQNGVGVDRMAR